MATSTKRIEPAALNLKEQVVAINRVTKVVKGGKNLSFSALVVIGESLAGDERGTWRLDELLPVAFGPRDLDR